VAPVVSTSRLYHTDSRPRCQTSPAAHRRRDVPLVSAAPDSAHRLGGLLWPPAQRSNAPGNPRMAVSGLAAPLDHLVEGRAQLFENAPFPSVSSSTRPRSRSSPSWPSWERSAPGPCVSPSRVY